MRKRITVWVVVAAGLVLAAAIIPALFTMKVTVAMPGKPAKTVVDFSRK